MGCKRSTAKAILIFYRWDREKVASECDMRCCAGCIQAMAFQQPCAAQHAQRAHTG